nr:hypothetical protein [Motilibacter deserti]
MATQHIDRRLIECDDAAAALGLGRADDELAAHLGDLLDDHQVPLVEGQVLPTESGCLAATEAADEEQLVERDEAVLLRCLEEPPTLVRAPRTWPLRVLRSELDVQRWVVRDEPSLDRGVERGAERGVNAPNRARAEGTSSTPGADRFVQSVEVVRAEVEQTDVAEVRKQVEPQSVLVMGRGGRLQSSLAREPGLEVLAGREGMHRDVGHKDTDRLLQRLLRSGSRRVAGLGGLQALAVAIAAVLQHVGPPAAAAMRLQTALGVTWAGPGVALIDGAVLHRATCTSSRSGAVGTRIDLPRWRTGVGQAPARMSSYAEVRPIPNTAAAVGTSTTGGS